MRPAPVLPEPVLTDPPEPPEPLVASETTAGAARWLRPQPSDTPSGVERTVEASWGDLSDSDDVTAISSDGDPPVRVVPPPEHGAIPVHVGPPPEAVPKRRSRLPEELFDRPSRPSAPVAVDPDRSRRAQATPAAALLLVVAAFLVWYLWS
ncbi:MAG: hypothetical protein R3F59_01765 [Myxococcota bacterium]